MMGRVSSCTPLITWTGPTRDNQIAPFLQWNGQLSEGQKEASKQVVTAIQNHQKLLVWAVCGAGKTEVLFAGIHEALQTGKRICIASPRTDVIHELTPRLQNAFPHIPVVSLFGGSEQKNEYSPLTLLTTHQLYRFQAAFDAVIVDEVDAFPYAYDKTLQFAVEKARKKQSSLILLTATPSSKLKKQSRKGTLPTVKIPVRYHGHPLPVPNIAWAGNWQKKISKGKLPHSIAVWSKERLQQQKQAFIFFPHIETMQMALPIFQQLHPDIQSVHAEDPERKVKVKSMRRGDIPILLTTTILERGVTVPGVDVAVVGADDLGFKEAALVQISGRVGRRSDLPQGNITFFHHGKTMTMVKAVGHIRQMNKEGAKRGWLIHE
ncbi:DEAD/DEAH box helicase [Falsibacillus albus]|nr:DEAD/DEAH box helicase family protein [Falsibacillus albus]